MGQNLVKHLQCQSRLRLMSICYRHFMILGFINAQCGMMEMYLGVPLHHRLEKSIS